MHKDVSTHLAEEDARNADILVYVNGSVNTTNACNFFIVRKGAVWT